MLKQIPNENPEEIRKNVARKARRFIACNRGLSNRGLSGRGLSANRVASVKIDEKKRAETKKDHGLIKNVCIRMIKFVQGPETHNKEQISDLIYGMQRSVLSLERQRQRMLQQDRKKKR
jgi:hypothetical protein